MIVDWQVVAVLIAFITAFATAVTTYVQWRADSRQSKAHALSLYREFVSPEYYRCVAGPACEVLLKFSAMPEPRRTAYRRTVMSGWAGSADRQAEYFSRFGPQTGEEIDPRTEHCERVATRTGLTEIQVLTTYLSFWETLHALIQSRLVHAPTLQLLFAHWWELNESMLLPLADEMDADFRRKSIAWRPHWIDAVRWFANSRFFELQPGSAPAWRR